MYEDRKQPIAKKHACKKTKKQNKKKHRKCNTVLELLSFICLFKLVLKKAFCRSSTPYWTRIEYFMLLCSNNPTSYDTKLSINTAVCKPWALSHIQKVVKWAKLKVKVLTSNLSGARLTYLSFLSSHVHTLTLHAATGYHSNY